MQTNVGILAIGNEVVEGQITNRNASWLSQQMSQMGGSPLFHLSCRDEGKEIHDSLNFLSRHCHLILVCGGLGPTKDDFTRQSLSAWSEAPLELNREQWSTIQQKLNSREVMLRQGHKNQAYIPVGAQVLENNNGVAPGFFIKTPSCFLASLPGPPRELQLMFSEQLKPIIEETIRPRNKQKLYTWICLGAPESEVAHIVESLIGDKFEFGFRLHKPYVEVKVWADKQLQPDAIKLFSLLKEKLKPWLVSNSIHSIRKKFHNVLKNYKKVFIVDQISGGLFLEKLKEDFQSNNLRYQCFEREELRLFSKNEVSTLLTGLPAGSDDLLIGLFSQSDDAALLSIGGEIQSIKLPRNIPLTSKLGQLYIIENCFLSLIKKYGQEKS